jgi:hypothetical protein
MLRRLATALVAASIALAPLALPAAAGTFDVPTDDFYQVLEDNELVVDVVDGVFHNDLTTRGQCVVATDVTGLQGHLPLDSLGEFGQFRFSPNPDFNGVTTFRYTLGLVGDGCTPVPEPNVGTVTITVFEVNDPPAIQLDSQCLNGVTVEEDSGPFTESGHCVEMVSFGPADESTQGFEEWVVTSTRPELFSSKPKLLPVDNVFGQLAFTPADDANGTSTVTVRGRDGASASDGGDDLSDPVKFKITINAVDEPATPGPTVEAPSIAPTPEVTIAPTAAPITPEPTVASTPEPSPAGAPTGGGAPPTTIVVVILAIVLVGLVAGFVVTLYLPKWRAKRGGG